MNLLQAGLASGNSLSFCNSTGDHVTLHAQGNWGSPEATLVVQMAPQDTEAKYVDVYQDGAVMELSSTHNFQGLTIDGGVWVRVRVEGGTGPELDVYYGGTGVLTM